MRIYLSRGHMSIRTMQDTPADFWQYLVWMCDPEIMRFWDGMTVHFTPDMVEAKHRQRLACGVMPCFIQLDGKPIGYCQFYPTDAKGYHCPPEQLHQHLPPDGNYFGIDLFLAPAYRDQGLGKKAVSILCHHLFHSRHAHAALIDPKVHNTRAIACYKACGFRELFVVPQREEQDGVLHDSLIMALHHPETVPPLASPQKSAYTELNTDPHPSKES